MTGGRRRLALSLTLSILAGVCLAGCRDGLHYSNDWSSTDVLTVVEHGDDLVLVGIDTQDATAEPLAPLPDLSPSADGQPESAVLRSGGSVFVVATAGGDDGELLRVDFDKRELTRIARLANARLPIVDGDGLITVGGSEDSFTFQRFRLPDAASDAAQPLAVTPIASDGRCLVGKTGDAAPRIGFIGLGHQHAAPFDLGPGIPGGVACSADVGIVAVSGTAGSDRTPTPAATLVVVRSDGQTSSVTVDGQPHHVAINRDGSFAAAALLSTQGQAIQFIDPRSARTLSPDPIPLDLQPDAMLVHGDDLVIVGGDHVILLPIGGGNTVDVSLPGTNTTTALA